MQQTLISGGDTPAAAHADRWPGAVPGFTATRKDFTSPQGNGERKPGLQKMP